MLRSTLFALATVAILSTPAITTTDALARSGKGDHDLVQQEANRAAASQRLARRRQQAREFRRQRLNRGHRWTESFGFRGPDCKSIPLYDGDIKLFCF